MYVYYVYIYIMGELEFSQGMHSENITNRPVLEHCRLSQERQSRPANALNKSVKSPSNKCQPWIHNLLGIKYHSITIWRLPP